MNEGSSVSVTVSLSESTSQQLSIPVTAAVSTDYSGVPGNATVNSGGDSGTVRVTANDDTDCVDETVTLGFGTLPDPWSEGTRSTTTITINDDDCNAVTISGPGTPSYAENGTGTVATYTSDPSSQVRWSLGGTDSALFRISNRRLTFRSPPNFEVPQDSNKNNIYSLTVRASKTGYTTGVKNVSVRVNNVNEAPVGSSIDDRLVACDITYLPIDLSRYFSDPDANDRLTYRATANPTDVVSLTIVGSELRISRTAVGQTSVTVTATDSGDLSAEESFDVWVLPCLSAPSIKVDDTGDAIVAEFTLPQGHNFHYVVSLIWSTCIGAPHCTTQDRLDWSVSTTRTTATFTKSVRPQPEEPPYYVGLKACTTFSRDFCGPYNPSAQSVGQLTPPEILDVVPMSLRRAELTWEASDDADADTGYAVQAKYPGTDWANVKENAEVADGYEIELDDVRGGMGLDDHEEFSFQVVATDSSTPKLKLNGASDEIKIIDNPILTGGRANGSSTSGSPQVRLEWGGVSGTDYTIRYRKLGGYSFIDHTNPNWPSQSEWPYPGETQSTVFRSSSSTVTRTISVEEMGEIYAFQVNYLMESANPDTPDIKVFSARDAYAWPSDGVPIVDSRVGTYPFFGYWAGGNYGYTVCRDTFYPPNISHQSWEDLIDHAFEQWELAAPDLLTVTNQGGDCLTDGSPIDNSVPITLIKALYNERNEVYMVDRSTWGPGDYIDITTNNHLFWCIAPPLFPNPDACVISTRYRELEHGEPVRALDYGSVDVLVNGQPGSAPRTQRLDIPGEDTFASYRDTRFNECHEGDADVDFLLYDTMVHEAGHALGLSHYSLDFIFDHDAHPTIPDSVMNYDSNIRYFSNEPDCSPHPFDIMAIEALYQTLRFGGNPD